MPTVNSDIFLSNSNITSIKLGNTSVSKVFLGNSTVFETIESCPDSTSSVKMTGWVAGDRILSPIGYAPYGRETYIYGDEAVRYETGVWLYTNSTYGELARAYSYADWPWLVDWPSPYAAQKVRQDGTACDSPSSTPTPTSTPSPTPPSFGSSGFQWMTMNSITESTASGIGQNNITISVTQSGGGMFLHNGAVGATNFPVEYGVPTSGNQIANTQPGVFTAIFSSPVTDALVAFASVGQAGLQVPVMVLDGNSAPKPFTPIWSSNAIIPGTQTTYLNQVSPTQYTQFVGEEGYNIIRIDGTMSSVTFNYGAAEYYCTVCFGFVDQNV